MLEVGRQWPRAAVPVEHRRRVLRVGPGPQVEGGMAAVGVAEVDQSAEGTGGRVDEGVLGAGVGVKADRHGGSWRGCEAFVGDPAYVGHPRQVGVGIECGREAGEGVGEACAQVRRVAVAGYEIAGSEGGLVDGMDGPQGPAELGEGAAAVGGVDGRAQESRAGDAGEAEVLGSADVAVTEHLGDGEVTAAVQLAEEEGLLGEAGTRPEAVRPLGLDDQVAFEEVGAGLAAGLVDRQEPPGVWDMAVGGAYDHRFVEHGIGGVGLEVDVGEHGRRS